MQGGNRRVSVSTHDDDERDLLAASLYTREWKLVGSKPPKITDDDTDSETEHLVMCFVQCPEQSSFNSDKKDVIKPLRLYSTDSDLVETMPVTMATLGIYYNYFKHCVITTKKGETLVNICRDKRKSPCVDIPRCALVVPKTDKLPDHFIKISVGSTVCVPLIPTSIIHNVCEMLNGIGLSIVPSHHDAWAYSCSRTRMSDVYTDYDIPKENWKGNTYTQDYSSLIECTAVATATFTVSFVLSPYPGNSSMYVTRKTMSIVIHSIK